jgi:hypothetical protein
MVRSLTLSVKWGYAKNQRFQGIIAICEIRRGKTGRPRGNLLAVEYTLQRWLLGIGSANCVLERGGSLFTPAGCGFQLLGRGSGQTPLGQ